MRRALFVLALAGCGRTVDTGGPYSVKIFKSYSSNGGGEGGVTPDVRSNGCYALIGTKPPVQQDLVGFDDCDRIRVDEDSTGASIVFSDGTGYTFKWIPGMGTPSP
jgi:hypothetical protein